MPTRQTPPALSRLSSRKPGWWAKDGYVHYGITVRNPNSVAAANAVVQVTLFDEQGTVQGTWESAIGLVKAEQTV